MGERKKERKKRRKEEGCLELAAAAKGFERYFFLSFICFGLGFIMC